MHCVVFTVVMAITTLYFERRDQHRAEADAGETLDGVIEDDGESVKSVELL